MQIELRELLKTTNLQLADLAELLKVDKSTVTRWAQRRIPAERVVEIERATGIHRAMLRPDLFTHDRRPKKQVAA